MRRDKLDLHVCLLRVTGVHYSQFLTYMEIMVFFFFRKPLLHEHLKFESVPVL